MPATGAKPAAQQSAAASVAGTDLSLNTLSVLGDIDCNNLTVRGGLSLPPPRYWSFTPSSQIVSSGSGGTSYVLGNFNLARPALIRMQAVFVFDFTGIQNATVQCMLNGTAVGSVASAYVSTAAVWYIPGVCVGTAQLPAGPSSCGLNFTTGGGGSAVTFAAIMIELTRIDP